LEQLVAFGDLEPTSKNLPCAGQRAKRFDKNVGVSSRFGAVVLAGQDFDDR
jgi:hypothetical protein